MTDLLDRAWLRAHPLPEVSEGGDKKARGQVFVLGGAAFVPGALQLTGEAALRAGAGRLRMATVEQAAMAVGVLMPESSMIALPADERGEIAPEAAAIVEERLAQCDALIFGPGMSVGGGTERLVAEVLRCAPEQATIILDAGALTASAGLRGEIAARCGRTILTPHHGEMCRLADVPIEEVKADPAGTAARVARDFAAVVALKGEQTIVIAPEGPCARFEGGNNGLATSGSGDVLAGLVGGFAARGAEPWVAAAWGVYTHGTAGERAADKIGPIGYLARELLPHVPRIVADVERA